MERVKCQHCGLVEWEAEQSCRRCGHDLSQAAAESAETRPSPVKKFALILLLIAVATGLAYKYRPSSYSTGETDSVAAKKPLNIPGEAIDVRQHLAAGKNTIVYFYADW